MGMKPLRVVLVSAVTTLVFARALAQSDTTWREFYPLGLGDLWQYTDQSGNISTWYVAAADTLLPNGQRYAELRSREYSVSAFHRVDSNGLILSYAPVWGDTCGGPQEVNIHRLAEDSLAIWRACPNNIGTLYPPPYFYRYDGILVRPIFGAPREVKHFSPGVIATETGDTIFYAEMDWIVRGIGFYRWENLETGPTYLTGAIINGVQYGTVVAVEEAPRSEPAVYSLCQNYPNPFNSSTVIRYDLPGRVHVSLKVYNVLGQEVAEIADRSGEAGTHHVIFEVGALPSGVYVYLLRVGSTILSRRMIVIK